MTGSASQWATVLTAGGFIVYWLAFHVPEPYSPVEGDKTDRRTPLPPRPRTVDVVTFLMWQLLIYFFLYFLYREGGWSCSSVGISTDLSPYLAFALGVLCYCLVLPIWALSDRLLGARTFSSVEFLAIRRLLPRRGFGKGVAFVAICVFNPVTEECLFRGILVFQLGTLIQSHSLAVVVGLCFNLALHRYQGVRTFPNHAIFYATSVVLLFSPAGLIAAIGLHAAGDLYPYFCVRAEVRKWRNYLRGRRESMSIRSSNDAAQ